MAIRFPITLIPKSVMTKVCVRAFLNHIIKQEGAAWLISDGWVRKWAGLRVMVESQIFVETALYPALYPRHLKIVHI